MVIGVIYPLSGASAQIGVDAQSLLEKLFGFRELPAGLVNRCCVGQLGGDIRMVRTEGFLENSARLPEIFLGLAGFGLSRRKQ